MIHKTAIIDKNAIIEENVKIGPYTVIGQDTIIRSGTKIYGQSFIECADIGSNCKIFSFSSIGGYPQDLKYCGEKTKVIVGSNTIIRECVTLNRGTIASGNTIIGKNCMIMSCAHIAHDCVVGNEVIVGYSTGLAGHVKIGDCAVLSASIGIHQFCKIGKFVMLGAGSMVSMDIIPYVTAYGDRAILAGLNVVGLRRRKVEFYEIENIKEAYRILFMSKLTLNNAITQLENSVSPYVRDIVAFIRNSKRGIARPRNIRCK
ncbi:MAG: acyl-ACP--UDP-N-acetylglucosamine O-acyltransferase [Endomicrobium sp.]|jgi:UDP-N-acetylglucosamine acyltransferase|nr:acyl-ACP--UDP-N-acetylglucosamine O-acyltransferase [Endomicrobium sp.]